MKNERTKEEYFEMIRAAIRTMSRKALHVTMLAPMLTGCFSHKYVVLESEKPRQEEIIELKSFAFAGFVPLETDLRPERLCPGSRIRMINMYDSGLDGLICGATVFVFCPHTVGVECEE